MSAQAKGSGCTFWWSFMIGCDVPYALLGRHESVQSCSGSRWIHEMPVRSRSFGQFFCASLTVQKSFAALDHNLCYLRVFWLQQVLWIRQNLQLEVFPSNVAWPEMSTDLCPATRALSPKPLSSFVNYMIIWYLKSDTVISFERGGPIEQPAALENFWLAGFPAVSRHDASAVESVPYREFPCEKPMQIHADPCSFKSNLKALFNISWMLWKFADLAAWYLRHLFS